ncbi:hypothetical protein SESBI_45676 [Sesbania bispinosa]|nr:hypothetical protein SESBI_45676 [Sesbania bispinosa]
MEDSFSLGNSGVVSSTTKNEDLETCRCGIRSKLQASWTETNPGRRFIGCGKYDGSSIHCGFFCWYNPPTPKFAGKVIIGLLKKNEKLKAKNEEFAFLVQKLEQQEKEEKNLSVEKIEQHKTMSWKERIMFCVILIVLIAICLQMY